MPKDRRPTALAPPGLSELPLMSFVPKLSPEFSEPYHLAPMISSLETLPRSKRREVVAIPVRHGKSTALHHAIVWWLLRDPTLQIIYYGYGLTFAQKQNRVIRNLYLRAGGEIADDMNTLADWRTPRGGGVLATSRDGTLTGYGCDLLIVDDPIKNRAEAENAETRDQIDEGFRQDALTRLTAAGASMVVASRWHEDDLSGRLLRRGWDHIHLKAVTEREDGTRVALWPDVRPLDYLDSTLEEIGPYGFESLFQGSPIPPNNSLFPGVHAYAPDDVRPSRVFVGVDLAYSSSSRADYTSILVLGDYVDHYRVLDLLRGQWTIGRSKAEVRMQLAKYPDSRAVSYVSGPEKGVLNLLLEDGIQIERMPAKFGKFTRAQRASHGWAGGRIKVDPNARWCDGLVSRLRYFTGAEGELDDEVDALVSAYDAAELGRPVGWAGQHGFTFGRRSV